jgi:quercetin dioxygenase-like cupin family protein
MPIEIFSMSEVKTLGKEGVSSLQLLWPGNSPDAKATVTRVNVAPGASQPRHSHADAEQIWIVEEGSAELLLADGERRTIGAGHVVRTPAGEVHGVTNSGTAPFVYLAITTPPVDFRGAYEPAS